MQISPGHTLDKWQSWDDDPGSLTLAFVSLILWDTASLQKLWPKGGFFQSPAVPSFISQFGCLYLQFLSASRVGGDRPNQPIIQVIANFSFWKALGRKEG